MLDFAKYVLIHIVLLGLRVWWDQFNASCIWYIKFLLCVLLHFKTPDVFFVFFAYKLWNEEDIYVSDRELFPSDLPTTNSSSIWPFLFSYSDLLTFILCLFCINFFHTLMALHTNLFHVKKVLEELRIYCISNHLM